MTRWVALHQLGKKAMKMFDRVQRNLLVVSDKFEPSSRLGAR